MTSSCFKYIKQKLYGQQIFVIIFMFYSQVLHSLLLQYSIPLTRVIFYYFMIDLLGFCDIIQACTCGEIGIHATLRWQCLRVCQFESSQVHHIKLTPYGVLFLYTWSVPRGKQVHHIKLTPYGVLFYTPGASQGANRCTI